MVTRSRKTGIGGGLGDTVVKRMTLPGGAIPTTAGAIVAVNTGTTSALVQSAPATEFASFAARYQQYRVRQIRLRLSPVYPANGTPLAAGNVGHSQMYVSDYIGTSVPGTAAQILADEGGTAHPTNRVITFTATWAKNPNAKLWNPTNAAVPAANLFGISFASNPTAGLMVAACNYFVSDTEWIVEFRGSQ